jgi:ATP-binding cassette subfamily B protein
MDQKTIRRGRILSSSRGGDIEFNHDVSFTYPDTGIQALRDVSSASGRARRWLLSNTGLGGGGAVLAPFDVSEGSISVDGADA